MAALPVNRQTAPLLKRLMRDYVLTHKKLLWGAVGCMVLAASMTALNAWMLQPVLDNIFINKDRAMLMLLPVAVIAVAIMNGGANYGQSLIMRYIGQSIIATMQMQLFRHLIHSDLSSFHDKGAGHLISRFTNDIQLMRNSVANVLTGMAKEFLTAIFLIGVMFHQSMELALIALVVFPVAFLPVMRLGRRMRKLSDSTQQQLGSFTAQLDETFQGVRIVKAYAREEYEVARARGIINTLFTLYFKSARVQSAATPMMETFGAIAIAAVIWYGGAEVIKGQTTPGAFFSFIAAMIMAYRPAKTMASLNTTMQEGLAAAQRLFQVLDRAPTIVDRPHAGELALSQQADIRFENVAFHYGPDTGGVSGVSLEIPTGKTVALVGPSGSGKSTLMNLLLRFYDVQDGGITINGQDIRAFTQQSLRRNMALVSQETVLFDDTVRANIRYGLLDATDEQVAEAAKRAAADEFIRRLPEGYDTLIGPHGVKLSGGQRQRLSIARALLKNAPILLLDEATSSLDTESEKLVQQALSQLMQNRSTLVIAHRLSTVMQADRIYVIDHGKVAEFGTHSELLAKEGLYYQLYARQVDGML